MRARATTRLDGGRGKELDIQAKRTTKPTYDWAMRKLLVGYQTILSGADQGNRTYREMYRAAVFIVAMEIMKPLILVKKEPMM
jgi:hypothetical protein